MTGQIGLLLVNLGTPLSPNYSDVYRYLIEFLTDRRVMDFSWLKREILVRGLIVPKRFKSSAHSYQQIWTKQGSPLMVHTQNVSNKLQKELGDNYKVAFAMRYQEPSLNKVLSSLLENSIDHLIVFPLFPQYASATTGSVYQKIMELIKDRPHLPKLSFLNDFGTHPAFIRAIKSVSEPYLHQSYDQILFSFHGLPERQVQINCRKTEKDCSNLCSKNRCYVAQCYATSRQIRNALNIPEEKTSIAFQSRLGKEPWIQPYTSELIQKLGKEGKKRILVFCPSFVCDCLETIYEISVEYQKEFVKAGGEKLELVPGLNDHDAWILALAEIVREH